MPKAKTKKTTKKKEEAAPPPVPKRIRVLFSGANADRCYIAGRSYRVPEQVPEESARAWLRAGKAEEDKSGEGPAETK